MAVVRRLSLAALILAPVASVLHADQAPMLKPEFDSPNDQDGRAVHVSDAGWGDQEVSESTGGFESWPVLTSLPADRRGPLDRNGPLRLPNLLSYAMALDPGATAAADLPALVSNDPAAGTASFRYRRSKDVDDTFLRPQLSEDLAFWTDADPIHLSVVASFDTFDLVELTHPVPAHGQLYFRLEAGAGMAPEFVLVQGGTLVTSNALNGTAVATFYIGHHEVTWGEWKLMRDWAVANGYDLAGVGAGCLDDHPVHSVNWFDVLKWSNARSEVEGLTPVYTVSGAVYRTGEPDHTTVEQNLTANGYRLPLEAEWEFAARGGNQTNGYTYAGSNDLNVVGWYWDNSGGAACNQSSGRGTWPVGQKLPNELGLYDMSGNVWEWCWDQNGSFRHVRGGSWHLIALYCPVSARGDGNPAGRSSYDGFRLARSSGN